MNEETKSPTVMPKYKSHKEVWALKIKEIIRSSNGSTIVEVEGDYLPIKVGQDYLTKHKPQVGGYWVKYEDGYESFSPAEAFEGGNTLIVLEVKNNEKATSEIVLLLGYIKWRLENGEVVKSSDLDYIKDKLDAL